MRKKLVLFAGPLVLTLVLVTTLLVSPLLEDVAHPAATVDLGDVDLEGIEVDDAVLGVPLAHGLYGGLIYWTEVIALDDTTSRVFVSTQSANSIFYADVDHSGETPSTGDFQVLPDLDADAGFGQIPMFTADDKSGWIYFSWWPEDGMESMDEKDERIPGLYKCNVEEGSLTSLEEPQEGPDCGPGRHISSSLFAHDGNLFFVEREEEWPQFGPEDGPQDGPMGPLSVTNCLTYGTLDEDTGDFTELGQAKINGDTDFWPSWENGIVHNPSNNCLYILNRGAHGGGHDYQGSIIKSDDIYSEIDSNTTFTELSLPPMNYEEGWTSAWWQAFGIGPDGRLFLLGWAQFDNYGEPCVAYTDNEGETWTTHARNRDEEWWGNCGPNMVFSGTSDHYIAYCGTMVSEDKGVTWGPLPRGANDVPLWGGNPVETDPNNSLMFYIPTHEGIAVSTDGGYNFNRRGGNLTIDDASNPWDVWFEDMAAAAINSTTTRVIVNQRYWKEKDNWDWMNQGQAFYYMDVDHSGDAPSYGTFVAIEGLTDFASAESSQVNDFILDGSSGYIFFEGERQSYEGDWWEHGLFKCAVDAATVDDISEVTKTSVAEYTFNMGGTWVDGSYDGEEPTWIDGHYEDAEGNWLDDYQDGATWVDGHWSGEWPEWVDGDWVGGTTINEGDTYEEILHARSPLIHQGNMFFTECETDWNSGTWVDETYDQDGNYIPGHWDNTTTIAYLRQGTVAANGSYTTSASGSAVICNQELNPRCIVRNPHNNLIYILDEGCHWMEPRTDPAIYKSSTTWDAITSETTFTRLSLPEPASETDRYEWRVLQCAPDGRLFISGENQGQNWEQVIGFSADEGENWVIGSIDWETGQPGRNFGFIGDATDYDVICGNVVSEDRGLNWKSIPRTDGAKVVPNSACLAIDPNNSDMLYIPTSKGIGYSADGGFEFSEMNEGLTAVQIRDLVLDPTTGYGWSVAKSGIRYVTDYDTDPVWSHPIDPAGDDWSWYDTVDMDFSDLNGATAYASSRHNDKIFKTTDRGANWKCFRRPEPQYEPPAQQDDDGWGWHAWPRWEGQISDLKIDQNDSDRLFVGYDARWFCMDPDSTSFDPPYGQLWIVTDNGDTWTQILLRNSQETNDSYVEIEDTMNPGQVRDRFMKGDINVDDILVVEEEGKTVLYVAAHYFDEYATPVPEGEERWNSNGRYDHQTGLPYIYKIYRVEEDSSSTSGWSVTADLANDDLYMVDLVADSSGTLYAIGKTYDETTYNAFVEEFQAEFKAEMKERAERDHVEGFYNDISYEFYNHIYEMINGEYLEGYDPDAKHEPKDGDTGPAEAGGPPPDGDDDEMGQFFEQACHDFYDEYFKDWDWDADAYDDYFEDCFEGFFAEVIEPEFDKNFDDEFDRHFDMDWQHMMPQNGVRIVYKKILGGSWTALTMKGLNKSQSFHHGYEEAKEVIAVGKDPFDVSEEIPYVGFNKYLYYLPSEGETETAGDTGTASASELEWVLGYKYSAGTMINVIATILNDTASGASLVLPAAEDDEAVIYLGTGVGVYEQPMTAASVELDMPEGDTANHEIPEQTRYLGGDLGIAAVSIIVDIIGAPSGASIEVTIIEGTDAAKIKIEGESLYSLFDAAASEEDLDIRDVAYVVELVKNNLTDDNIGEATITLKVGKSWVEKYGTSAINIFRVSDDGTTQEILPTEFVEYDGDQAVFVAVSENGLSYFGLVAVDSGGAIPLSLYVAIVSGVLVIMGLATFMLRRRHPEVPSYSPVEVLEDREDYLNQ